MSNLKFEYLYRDAGNYKQFGEIILSNPSSLSPEEATKRIESHLIDNLFFFHQKVKIPSIEVHTHNASMDVDWYEFEQFSITENSVTDNRTIDEFIICFAKENLI